MAKEIDPYILQQAITDWKAAPQGLKTAVVAKWAERLDVAKETLYRALPTSRVRKKGDRLIEGIEAAVSAVAALKRTPPEHLGEISTAQAVELARANGLITEEQALASPGTYDRIMRDMGLNQRQRRIIRFQAERPNQLHHVDASSSKCFFISRKLPDGDFVMKLHAGVAGYKNKPVPIRLRPWIYGLTDDHSGVHIARYVAAHGESAGDNMDFLSWAWGRNDDSFLFGLPEGIKGDFGPMMSSEGAPDWFDRLGIDIDPSAPLSKEAHGKIERPWRSLWQRFELPFFCESEWKKFEISMSEINRRFMLYLDEQNNRSHRFERTISRRQAWERISLYGGAVALPENAIRTVVRRWHRKVDPAGIMSIDNILYEVKGLHDAWVWAYQGVFENKMVVVDERTGLKYDVEDFAPNKLGEYSAAPETPHQKSVKQARKLTGVSNTLYQEKPAEVANVARFPTRIKETRQLENPLDTDRLPSMEAALKEFQTVCGFVLSAEDRAAVSDLINQNGLSRKYVVDLALEIQAEQFERRYA